MLIINIFLLILNVVWTVFLYFQPSHTTSINYLYNLSYGLNFFLASYLCFGYIKKFLNFRVSLNFFNLSFISFFIAQLVWLYYNLIIKTAVPYPGWADFFWLLFYLLIATGFIVLLRTLKSALTIANYIEIFITAGIIFLIISSFLSLNTSQAGLPILTQFLNYAYPVADAFLIALSITTLRSQAGRLKTMLLFFIFGFIGLAVADTFFAYQTTLEVYWNGNIVDLIYAFSGFLLLMAIIYLPRLFATPETLTQINFSEPIKKLP